MALITLLERKVLSIRQLRVGPNKVGRYGLLQPAADAIKLFTNGQTVLGPINARVFIFSPVLALSLVLLLSPLININSGRVSLRFSLFLLLMVLSLNVYPLIGSGWASNSKYASLGGLRAAAQTISYEISLAFIVLSMVFMWQRFSFHSFRVKSQMVFFSFPMVLILAPWAVTVVAELNRTPFDFAEGESELVSGFNVEYGSDKFAIIFLAEYGIIYTFSILTAIFFAGVHALPCWSTAVVGIFLGFFVIWLRTTLPRFRYDLLILLSWKTLLPQSLAACQLVILLYRLL